jgi:patatin-like phospholipase/acyl hydrolase
MLFISSYNFRPAYFQYISHLSCVLVVLEEKLKRRTGNPQAKIGDFFDLIAGTSTGGILTCLYLCPDEKNPTKPRFSAQEAVDLYLKRGNEIFSMPLWKKILALGGFFNEKYPSKPIENILKDYLESLKLSQLIKPCLLTSYDIEQRKAFFFNQQDARKSKDYDYFLREIARATSAAPTFFEIARVTSLGNKSYSLIDGGVFANNPALCAYAEARTKLQRKQTPEDTSTGNPTAKDMVVLSLGSGDVKQSFNYQQAKNWGQLQWVRPLINIIMTGVAETVDYQMIQLFDSIKKPEQYLRINPTVKNHSPMAKIDNASPENLKELRQLANELAASYSKQLDKFIEFLI